IEFGSGKTELLNKDLLGTDVDKTQKDYDVNKKYSEALSTARDEEGYHDNSIVGRGLNAAAGGLSMLSKIAVVDTVDWIGEITGIGDLANEETKRKWTQNLFGYDDYFSKENMAEIEGHVQDMMKNGISWKGVSGALGSAFANIETTGESLGYIAGLMAGVGKFTKLGKAVNLIDDAEKIGKITSSVAKARIASQMSKATLAEKASYRIGQQAGLLNATTGMTNDHVDEFKKNNNGVGPTGSELAFMFGNNLIALATDRFTDISVLQSAGLLKSSGIFKTVKDSIKDIAKDSLPTIANKIIGTTAALAGSMSTEFAQEYYQTMSEQVNKQWGTDKYGDSLMEILGSDKNQLEALVGGVAGAGGAAHFQAAGAVPSAVKYFNKDETKELTEDQKNIISSNEEVKSVFEAETKDEISSRLDDIIPMTEAKEDGTFDKAEIISEYTKIYEKLIVPMRNTIENGIAEEKDLSELPLGTAKVINRRIRIAINKIDISTLDEKELIAFENAQKEVASFETELNNIFTNKVKKYSLAEIDAMTGDQLYNEFGAEAISEPGDYGFGGPVNEVINNANKKESKKDTGTKETIPFEIDDDADLYEKIGAIAEKTGNTKMAGEYKDSAKKKRAVAKTLETIFEQDFFNEDKGLVSKVTKAIAGNISIDSIEKSKIEVINTTKKWMVDNGLATSVDSVSDEDVTAFLSSDAVKGKGTAYYGYLNSNGIKSIADHDNAISKINAKNKDVLDTVAKLTKTKNSKYDQVISSMDQVAREISAQYDDFVANGIPGKVTRGKIKKVGTNGDQEINTNPTKEEIYEAIQFKFKGKTKDVNNQSFKIHYENMIDYTLDMPKDSYEEAGAFKFLDMLEKEIETLNLITADKSGKIQLGENLNKEVKVREEKKQAELDKEAEKISGKGAKFVSAKEAKDIYKEINTLETKLIKIQNKINQNQKLNDSGDLNMLQEELISEVAKTDSVARLLYKEYLRLKNISKKVKKQSYQVNKRLELVNKEIRKLKNERDTIIDKVKEIQNESKLEKNFKDKT
ncbi:MAG: hypothetical protein J7L15_06125, partial [Clostridiales bacterium]|nr:hypothetical protein [Clostridiales bacterium]